MTTAYRIDAKTGTAETVTTLTLNQQVAIPRSNLSVIEGPNTNLIIIKDDNGKEIYIFNLDSGVRHPLDDKKYLIIK